MVNITFKKQLPDNIPNRLPSYSLQRPKVNQTIMKNRFKELKLPLAPIQPTPFRTFKPEFRYVDNWTILKHNAHTVAMNRRSESLKFRNELRHGREFDAAFNISENKLEKIAKDYIESTIFVDDPIATIKKVKTSYLKTQGAGEDGLLTPEITLDAGVIFQRAVDNSPVIGLGGNVMINIAHDETIVAGSKVWRKIDKKLPNKKIMDSQVAVNTLKKRLDNRKIKKADIIRADFGYFEAGPNISQKYLEPSYAFVYETKIGNFKYKSVEVIYAIESPQQRWRYSKKYRSPTKTRT